MIFSETAILFFVFGIISGQTPTRTPCVWLFKSDTNTRGGIRTDYLNLAQCQEKCLEFNSCFLGLDWDPNNVNGIKCWFSNQTSIGSAPGVTHYYQSCAGSLTTDSLFTLPVISTSTTTQFNCDWIEFKDSNTKDGIPVSGANTTEDCKSKCFANLTCINGLGFDFNSNNPVDQRCYFSTSSKLYPNPGIVHYTPKSTCSRTFNSSSLPMNTCKLSSVVLMLFLLMEGLFAVQW